MINRKIRHLDFGDINKITDKGRKIVYASNGIGKSVFASAFYPWYINEKVTGDKDISKDDKNSDDYKKANGFVSISRHLMNDINGLSGNGKNFILRKNQIEITKLENIEKLFIDLKESKYKGIESAAGIPIPVGKKCLNLFNEDEWRDLKEFEKTFLEKCKDKLKKAKDIDDLQKISNEFSNSFKNEFIDNPQDYKTEIFKSNFFTTLNVSEAKVLVRIHTDNKLLEHPNYNGDSCPLCGATITEGSLKKHEKNVNELIKEINEYKLKNKSSLAKITIEYLERFDLSKNEYINIDSDKNSFTILKDIPIINLPNIVSIAFYDKNIKLLKYAKNKKTLNGYRSEKVMIDENFIGMFDFILEEMRMSEKVKVSIDENEDLKITLNNKTILSSGEQNLMSFIYGITLSLIEYPDDIILLDDPFDLADNFNITKIMFFLKKYFAKEENNDMIPNCKLDNNLKNLFYDKNIVILTHSSIFLNMFNSDNNHSASRRYKWNIFEMIDNNKKICFQEKEPINLNIDSDIFTEQKLKFSIQIAKLFAFRDAFKIAGKSIKEFNLEIDELITNVYINVSEFKNIGDESALLNFITKDLKLVNPFNSKNDDELILSIIECLDLSKEYKNVLDMLSIILKSFILTKYKSDDLLETFVRNSFRHSHENGFYNFDIIDYKIVKDEYKEYLIKKGEKNE